MADKTILFLHGFASSSHSAKAIYLGQKLQPLTHVEFHAVEFNPTPRDFECMTTTGLINHLRQYILDHAIVTSSIIGSSYGGLIAVHYAHRYGGVEKMLLLAPGLRWLSGGLSKEQPHARWSSFTAGTTPRFQSTTAGSMRARTQTRGS